MRKYLDRLSHRFKIQSISIVPSLIAIFAIMKTQNHELIEELRVGAKDNYQSLKMQEYATIIRVASSAVYFRSYEAIAREELPLDDALENLQIEVDTLDDSVTDLSAELMSVPNLEGYSPQVDTVWEEMSNTIEEVFESIEGGDRASLFSAIDNLKLKNQNLESILTEVLEKQSKQALKIFSLADRATDASYVFIVSSVLALVLVSIASSLFAYRTGTVSKKLIEDILSEKRTLDARSNRLKQVSNSLSETSTRQSQVVELSTSEFDVMKSKASATRDTASKSQMNISTIAERSAAGLKAMDKLVQAIEDIEKSNAELKNIEAIVSKIQKKTKAINDIVFKTQLLSVNASIESAKSGEYGRGFQVVAEEIGNLARTSGEAARDIEDLILDSKTNIKSIVDKSDLNTKNGKRVLVEVVSEITENIQRINDVSKYVSEITSAIDDQQTHIVNSTKAISRIEEVTRAIFESSERTLDESNHIYRQCERLDDVIEGFKILVNGSNTHKELNKNDDDQKGEDNERIAA